MPGNSYCVFQLKSNVTHQLLTEALARIPGSFPCNLFNSAPTPLLTTVFTQQSANVFCKEQDNKHVLLSQARVPVLITQPCHCNTKGTIDNMEMNGPRHFTKAGSRYTWSTGHSLPTSELTHCDPLKDQ